MRSESNGSFTTFLMFVPLVAVPLLAVFGLPEFSSVAASGSSSDDVFELGIIEETGVGESASHAADDLLRPVSNDGSIDVHSPTPASGRFAADGNGFGENSQDDVGRWDETSDQRPAQNGQLSHSESGDLFSPFEEVSHDGEIDQLASGVEVFSGATSDEQGGRNGFSDLGISKPSTSKTAERDVSEPPRQRTPRSGPRDISGKHAGPLTWQAAVRRLNELGIDDYLLQPGIRTGEFHFSCVFSPRDNPRVTHRFEAEADEPLTAIKKVLSQVESRLPTRRRKR